MDIHDLQIVECVFHLVQPFCVQLFSLEHFRGQQIATLTFKQFNQLPIGIILQIQCQLQTLVVRHVVQTLHLDRIILDNYLFDVKRIQVEQIGFNPGVEIGRQAVRRHLDRIHPILRRDAHESLVFVSLDRLADDQASQILALVVLHGNQQAHALITRFNFFAVRFDDTELGMVGGDIAGDAEYLDVHQGRSCIAYLILGVGRIVLM